MRKLLLTLTLLLTLGFAAAAAGVDILTNASLNNGTNTNSGGYGSFTSGEFTSGAKYAGQANFVLNKGEYSIGINASNKKGGDIVTTVSGGKASSVKITWGVNATTSTGKVVNIYGKHEAYSSTDKAQGTLIGSCKKENGATEAIIDLEDKSYEYIAINAPAAVSALSIEIVWAEEGTITPTPVAKPTFELVEGDYGFSVAIAAEEGAEIHYTTDGNEPTADSPIYSAPVEVWENTTFKAIAIKDGETSSVATYNAEIPFLLEDFMMLTTDSWQMMEGDFKFVVKGEIKVVYQSGSYLYVKCGNSYTLLYGYTSDKYDNGDTFSRVEGTFTVYNGLPEVKDYTLSDDKTAGTPVQPMELETVAYAGAMLNSYVTLLNVTVDGTTVTDADGNEITLRDQFKLNNLETSGTWNITGFIGYYINPSNKIETLQFYPIAFEVPSSEFVGVSHNPRIGKTVVNYDYTLHVNNHLEGQHNYKVTLKVEGVDSFINTEHTLAADEAEAEPAMLREAAFNATHRLNGSIKVTGLTGETNYKASMFVEMPNGEIHEEPVADFATGTVGITDVAVDEAEAAEYFNLQGVRVAQPEAGNLYIVRRGGKATKELVK